MPDSTSSSADRLDCIEAILAGIATQQERTQTQVDSNARAIEATTASISTLGNDIREGFNQARAERQEATTDVVSMMSQLAEDAAVERTELRQQIAETDQRFHVLLEEGRSD